MAGTNAVSVAVGLGAQVTVLDTNIQRLRELDALYAGRVQCIASNSFEIERALLTADLVIGSVLVPGAKAPKLVSNELVSRMKPGSVLVDIAVDQGGCFADTRPTTHADPTFPVHGSLFYCVANMPGAVPNTSTYALTNATMPYVRALANLGWRAALAADGALALGLNTHAGTVVRRTRRHGARPGALAPRGRPRLTPHRRGHHGRRTRSTVPSSPHRHAAPAGSGGGSDRERVSTRTSALAYSQTVSATGGATPYTFSLASGALPTWATLNASTGAITGTPNSTTTANFTIRATDANNCAATRAYTITPVCPAHQHHADITGTRNRGHRLLADAQRQRWHSSVWHLDHHCRGSTYRSDLEWNHWCHQRHTDCLSLASDLDHRSRQ